MHVCVDVCIFVCGCVCVQMWVCMDRSVVVGVNITYGSTAEPLCPITVD